MSTSKPERLGPYEISGEIGRGGMGVVYRGLDPVLQRTVAVKTIHTGTQFDMHSPHERLLREARSAAGLSHPNVVTVYQAAVDADCVYIAMEFVDGPTLEQWLNDGNASDIDATMRLLGQVAAGLDYAHHKGIVHRDIKPLNILIDEAGNARITDFGLAKASTSIQLTRTGLQVGTPQYVSPEQAQGKTLDGCSDQFSLAVIAFRALTGHLPFEADDVTSLIFKIVFEEPQSARHWNSDLPEPVDAVLSRALAKEPTGRYISCTEFIRELQTALHTVPALPPPPTQRPQIPVQKIAIGAGAAVGCLALMAGISALFSGRGGDRTPTADVPVVQAPVPAPPPPAPAESAATTPSAAPPQEKAAAPPKTDARVPKAAGKSPAPVRPPAVAKAPPRGIADWEKPDEWVGQSGWMVHKGGNFVLFDPNGQVGTFTFSALVFKGKRLQWVLNFQDPKNYAQFQIEKHQFSVKDVVNGSSKDRAKSTIESNEQSVQLSITLAPHSITTSIHDGGKWRVLDTWTALERNFIAGKFGFLIPGSDQVGLANFRFTPD